MSEPAKKNRRKFFETKMKVYLYPALLDKTKCIVPLYITNYIYLLSVYYYNDYTCAVDQGNYAKEISKFNQLKYVMKNI